MTILLVTNDFPPTLGGIQSYLRDYVDTLDPADVVVLASTQDAEAARRWDAGVAYRVVRLPMRVMLPTPRVAREMQRLIREHEISTVWFGAAAPLAVLARAARAAGAQRVVASTHGHEVGWSMIPGARQVLRHIGRNVDCLTFVSRYARGRMAAAFGPDVAWEPMPGGVDVDVFHPDVERAAALRQEWGVGDRPTIVAVSRLVPRKGQDTLVRSMPHVVREIPDARLVLVGPGDFGQRLRRLATRLGVDQQVLLTGPVPAEDLAAAYGVGDVFALPVRTQWGGLSVEGLGIVFLEAQACGVATVAGRGGGAPETVIEGVTGRTVDGRDPRDVAGVLVELLSDAGLRERLSAAGREQVQRAWTWDTLGAQLRAVLAGDGGLPVRHSWNFRA